MNENIVVKVGADISNLSKNLSAATRDLGSFGNDMKNVGAGMAMSFGAATLAIGGGLGYAVKKAADFDTQIRKAGAIAGATAQELDAMKEASLRLGATTSESASSVAVAMTDLAAKGFTANETIAAMPGIISAAAASGEDLSLAADTVASALNIFGLEAAESSRVADILAESANTSAAGIDDLGYVLKYAGAPAAALGISLEEVAAAAGIMTNAGLDGSNAGTALRASLLALNNPAKAQEKIMQGLGFTMQDSEGKTKSLSEIIGDLTASMEGMTEADKVATLAKLVGTEAVSGFLSLTKAGPAEIDKMSEALRNSAGASEEAAAKMKAGIGGALENLSGAFESLTITIGDQLVPYVQTAAEWLAKLAERFTNLSDGTKKFLVVGTAVAGIFTAIVAAIGITLAIVGSAITGLTAIAGAMGIATGASGLLAAAFGVLTGPIGITIAAIAGIIAILVLAYKKVDWFRDGVNKAWATIKAGTTTAFNAIKSVISKAMADIAVLVGDILGKLKAFWSEHGASITKLVKGSFEAIWGTIKSVMGYIKGIFEAVWPIISGVVQIAWGIIKLGVKNGLDVILGLVGTVMKLLEGDWKGAWDTIKSTAESIWENIEDFFSDVDLVQIGKDIIAGLVKGIGSMSDSVIRVVSDLADLIPDWAKKILGVASPSRVMKDIGKWTGRGLVDGMEGEISAVERMAKTLAEASVADLSGTGGYSIAGYKTPSTSAGIRSSSLATGGSSANGGAVTNNYYATIDAKNVTEFNKVVDFMQALPQQMRKR